MKYWSLVGLLREEANLISLFASNLSVGNFYFLVFTDGYVAFFAIDDVFYKR
jgi:hypothetical protein